MSEIISIIFDGVPTAEDIKKAKEVIEQLEKEEKEKKGK